MIRRAYIIAIAALGLAVAVPAAAPGVSRFVSSARSARHHFNDLKNSDGLNAIERLFFSVVLANTKAHASPKQTIVPTNRT